MSSDPTLTNLTLAERRRLLQIARSRDLERKGSELPPIGRAARDERIPLSFAQQRLWFLEQLGDLGSTYHLAKRLRLQGPLNRDALRRTLDGIVARHEVLRTTFAQVDGVPEQRIAPVEAGGFRLEEHDLSGLAEADAELARLTRQEARARFDLDHGPLVRGRLIRLGADDHVLLVTMHHVVSDGWSTGVFFGELSALYAAHAEGTQANLPELPVQYADFAAWQRRWVEGDVLRRQADYWTQTLRGAPELLEVPADRPRPAEIDHTGARVDMALDAALTAELKALSRRHGATLYMTLLAAWGVVLARLSGVEDVVVGTPSAGRGRPEIERLIGFFVNTLAVRMDLSGAPTVAQLLGRVKERVLDAQQHQDIPFEQVVERVDPVRSLSHHPLFQALFAWQNTSQGEGGPGLPGLSVSGMGGDRLTTAKLDLSLSMWEFEDGISGGITYSTALFDRETIERYTGYLRRVLEQMAADDGMSIERLTLMPAEERARVLDEWNRTEADYPRGACIHEMIQAQAERTPDATAVVYEGDHLTYAELNAGANRLAHHLRSLGVGPDARVAVCAERGLETMVGLLAVLKAGGAYVPLDPTYPAERLAYMLEDGAPAVVLVQRALRDRVDGAGVPVLELNDPAPAWASAPGTNPPRGALTAEHAAYVIYTSGSTGTPKGVVVPHRAVASQLAWAQRTWSLGADEAVLQRISLSFDVSVRELFWALTVGARVVLAGPGGANDPAALVQVIKREGVGAIHSVPTLLQAFLEHPGAGSCTTLTRVMCGGEVLSPALARRFQERLPGAALYHMYGPTETTVAVTAARARPEAPHDRLPLGRPVANTRAYVLDGRGEPVPVGAAGELCIGGAQVARGYLGRPALTAERFVADPFAGEPGARMYRTGDRARWLPDGTLEFLGRDDHQVKLRGFRVELGEIEARLLDYPAVREAVVMVRQDAPGEQRLVAYVAGGGAGADALRAWVSETLPEYMVPAAYVRLDALPLTPNGKVDRGALPSPEGGAFVARAYEPPAGDVEEILAAIWAEVLGVERVGRRDSFFELGGHSLLAVRVISRVRQALRVEVALGELFTRPVLGDFARGLETGARAELPPIEPADREGRLPLSFAQQRLWFLERMGGLGGTYHIRSALRLRGALDAEALARALDDLVARHEALRTTFAEVDGLPEQRIAPADSGFHLVRHDVEGERDAEAALRRVMAEEAETPFDLERGPLIRGRLVRLAADDHVLLLTRHHVVSDAWSGGVLFGELSALYAARREGRDAGLPALPVQYADYAAWQRRWVEGEVLEAQAAYWMRMLDGAPELLELPTDRPRPARQDFGGAVLPVELDDELAESLRALSRRHGTTLFMTVLAGWAAVLGRLSGQAEVVIGTPSANRGRREIEGLIGFFLNSLPLRISLAGAPTVAELLGRARTAALEAQQHQDIPFEQVVERVQPARSMAYPPVFQVLFAWQSGGAGARALELPGVSLGRVDGPPAAGSSKFDMTLSLREVDGRIAGQVEYATALFDRETVERHADYLRRILAAMAAADDARVDRLPLLSDAERWRVVEGWNATDADFPADAAVHELVQAQAARTPDAVALAWDGGTMSYGELNARANRLAHFLAERGVGPDVCVGLCVERSPEMVVGLLAALKAGGAYVPLDPGYPEDRLRYMLEDSAPAVLLTQSALRERFAGLAIPVFSLDADASAWSDRPETDPARGRLTAEHLMYVMYTSGSTGRPKGVMMGHRSVVNRMVWMQARHGLGAGDVMLQKTTYAFDVSVWELFWPLFTGARLLLARPDGNRDPAYLVRTVRAAGVTDIHFVPSMLPLFLDEPGAASCTGLRRVYCSGEALPPALVRRFRELLPDAELHNWYGPTEGGEVSYWQCAPGGSDDIVPIGFPIANTRLYVLDAQGQPVPRGVAGELLIGGTALGRGYWNRPALTAERFIPDPFGQPGSRLYRTGDLCRWMPDGAVEYLGRNDFQIKIRGFRVELGDIESRLVQHPAVREAAVVAREESPGDRRLVAYYVADEPAPVEALRAHLGEALPEYMVPAAFVHMAAWPLTPTGKLDRKALPAPAGDSFAARGYEAPATDMETVVARVWAELLRADRVGRQDHFFDLGGHSLLAVQVISRVRQALGVQVELGDLFARPVLSDFARELETAARSELPPIGRAPRDGRLPLSFAQQRLWFLEQLGGTGAAYQIPLRLRLRGALDRAALGRALDGLVARHEALRTTFAEVDGVPEQRIAPAEAGFHLVDHDLAGRADELGRWMADEARAPFDLERGPLIRGRLFRLAADDHVLVLTMHHIVSDGWSMGILTGELAALYAAFVRGGDARLPALEVQYADYAVWQRRWIEGEVLEAQAEYWTRTLAGAPELLELPADRPRPAQMDPAGGRLALELDEELTAGLAALSRRHGTTLFMTLMAGWAVVLSRLSGQDDVVIGTPTAGRGRREIEGLIGFFVSTLALRVDLSGAPTVAELLERIKQRAVQAQHHQDIPFEQVVERVAPVRSLSHTPLFQAMFAWQSTPRGGMELPGLALGRVDAPDERVTVKQDLGLTLGEADGRIVGSVTYAASLFDHATVERWAGYLRRVLAAMVAGENQAVGRLPMLPPEERARVLDAWNRTDVEFARESCAHELFEQQVQRAPDALALSWGGNRLSYAELNARANRLAHHLRSLGVGPDTRVAISVERGPEMVVALLAVLKAGGAYVPLDPNYPEERLRWMLEDSAPALLLTRGDLAARFADAGLPLVDLDDDTRWSGAPSANPERGGLRPEHPAYLIYTSGSTGRPKGAIVQHRNVAGMVAAQERSLPPETGTRVLQFASFSFDGHVYEVFLALARGASLHLSAQPGPLAGDDLVRIVADEGITHAILPPAVLAALPEDERLPSIRTLIVSGDAPPAELMARWSAGRRLINGYGPTEATVCTTLHDYVPGGSTVPPIGRPVANVRVYLLDADGGPVPLGTAGELYIGGATVGRGYWRRPALTAERFVPDPFGAEPGARLYRTGDLARWTAEGELEFAGRVDAQVKVRGFRVELGEIETRLLEHPAVREAVVLVREDAPGDRRLVAYVVGDEAAAADVLRAHVSSALPDYMVPAAYVRLERFPITPNGKVDRRALPAPEGDAFAARAYEAPVGEVETALAEVWSEVLGLERVGRNDGFFELGGHSLLAVTLIARMRQRGLHADVRALFTAPTLAALAAAVGGETGDVRVPPNRIPAGSTAITPEMLPLVSLAQPEIDGIVATVPGGAANVQDIYPLAPLQEGFLFHQLVAAEGDPYLLGSITRFPSREALDAHLEAFNAVVARHDILRTGIVWEGLPEPVQVVWRQAPLPVEEVELDPAGGDAARQLYARFDPRRHGIDIRRAPLLRCHVARETEGEGWVLLVLLHHLAGDHTTLGVLREEIAAHLEGRAGSLPQPVPFRGYVAQARLGVSREEHRAFFEELLGDVDEPTAPFGLLDVQGDGSGINQALLRVHPPLAARLRRRARALGVSAATLCHVAWAQVLARVSGRDDVVFGTLLLGRMTGGEDAERMMGPSINTLPVRIPVAGAGVEESVRRTHALLARLLRHEHASLALAQRCSGVQAPAPLFTSLLNYRHGGARANSSAPAPRLASAGGGRSYTQERSNYPLTMSVDDLGEAMALTAKVRAPVEAERVCQMMHTALEGLVEALETAPERPVGSLDVLPAGERETVLEAWNQTRAEYPAGACVHELFQAQVARTPDAPAVVFGGACLTYAELNARANRLAHYLARRGVGPDVSVGLCLERGPEMVVALLAVLKAGGAYVPLDPEYPEDRLRWMLEDSAPAVLLAHASLADRFAGADAPCIRVDADAAAWADEPDTNPARGMLTPDHLVYVIYTSGSTGRPKGVMNQHRALVNRLAWGRRAWDIGADEAVLCKTSLNFDGSVREIFLPLSAGGRVVIAAPGGHRDPAYLLDVIGRENITTVNLVPSLLQALLDADGAAGLRGLRRILCGGEALPGTLVERCRQLLPGVELHNLYGPSEAATAVTTRLAAEGGGGAVPIGGPSANARVYVRDGAGEPVPVGVAGELFIGGVPVARGYLGRPGLTAERFVPDPFGAEPGARLYRTGDVVRWLPDGRLAFVGRNDDQIKVRGFRVEPGEVEARLREHPAVAEAVVVANRDDGAGRLVAYWVGGAVEPESLRQHLRERLPDYMVPAAYVHLPAIPLNPSGKADRRALPAPGSDAFARRGYEAPVGEVETALAEVWAEVLGIDRVGRNDGFFELGGHSLLAVALVAGMRRRGLHADVRALFATPTLAEFASAVSGAHGTEGGEADGRAIALCPAGSGTPLFLVYEGGGSTAYARVLHPHIDRQIPVYALPAPAADAPLREVDEMAARLAGMIRDVQPSGPYRVAGWSFGGVLAYATAARLMDEGQAVEFVGMFDSYCPTHPGVMARANESGGAASAGSGDVDLESLAARLRREGRLPAHVTLAEFREMRERRRLHRLALRGYSPRAIGVPVHLFPARDSAEPDLSRGWGELLPAGSLRVTPVPGTHDSMMEPAHAAVLGRALSESLRAAENGGEPRE